MDGKRTRSRLPWVLAGLILAVVLTGIVFLILGRNTQQPATAFAFRGYGLPLAIVFAAAGVLVASRVPANPIGWLLLAAGAGTAIQELAQQYAIYGLLDSPGSVPRADVAAWIPEWVWIPFMGAIALYVPLFYPDGHLPSRRWSWVAVLGGIGATIGTFAFALTPGPLEGFLGQRNPFGVEAADWIRTIGDGAMLVFLVALLGTAASLVVRVRRSRGDERQQLKWLALAISLLGFSFLVGVPFWALSGTGGSLDPVENLVVLGLAGVPVAIGISILKYRLYDIDVVINRAVVYGILAAFITIVYGAIVVGIGALVGSGGNAVLSAVAAAVIAVAFQPARHRAQRLANRVVYGDRATPYEVLSGFSGRLAETYSIEDVLPRLARVLADGVGATRVAISLGSGARERTLASYPEPADAIGDERLFEVRHQGELLGRIALAMPPNESLVPSQEKLVADVAAQAGLVLRNAALIEDLRASRQRLVAAQDQERRRIERNIHDGAQQQLVALAVKLRLVDGLVRSDEGRAHAMLAELHTETNQALEDLRDLARGIYPPLLADKGLGAALESQARKSPVPVSVEIDGIGRYPQDVEAAVYFSCLEALQNVTKYAGASRTTIRLSQTDGILTFEVVDDGRGFDPRSPVATTTRTWLGLTTVRSRLAEVGGTLVIESSPGNG
ncbi:MAG: histidine kinase, partial [Actinomycetota bacterium]